MPTLVTVPVSRLGPGNNRISGREGEIKDDETIFDGDESTIFHEDELPQGGNTVSKENRISPMETSPIHKYRKTDKSVTFDESFILLKKGTRPPRRDTLNSDVSLLSCDNTFSRDKSILSARDMNDDTTRNRKCKPDGNRPWSRRDEYHEKYQTYVKTAISNFDSKFPGTLRQYRSMSLEEKAEEQKKVMVLLTRLGASRGIPVESNCTASPSVCSRKNSFKSPIANSRLMDETLSPLFSPDVCDPDDDDLPVTSPLPNEENNDDEENSLLQNHSNTICGRSELLLSMDDGDTSKDLNSDKEGKTHSSRDDPSPSRKEENDFEFPVNNDDMGHTSDASMEIVRRAAVDEQYYSDNGSSCMTPEDRKISRSLSRKREATTSGKRGTDLRRSRHYDQENEYEISAQLGRLSISPSVSPPPEDFFVASQSPISPRLTCDNDDYGEQDYGGRISLGRDSGHHRDSTRRESSTSVDSLATNTPPARYRSKSDQRRAFRDAPVNVGLKKGATFHLEKIPVKHMEIISSNPLKANTKRTKPAQRRRLVNFPDPLIRYGSRKRRALKEMYSWVRRGERDCKEGDSREPAVGAFFSLSEEQIIDICKKLLLDDYKEQAQCDDFEKSQSNSWLTGKTLVVLRSKEDIASWESALREGNGCSVLNHTSLPLSERIRASTSEKACLYDVVLTTYDAMKSPDVAVPINEDGHVILNKPTNDTGWHASRSSSQRNQTIHRQTKQLSILHRIQFSRIIFVDNLGRKSYLAKSGTARAVASIALSSRLSRLAFFKETEADGANALLALRKSDKRAFQSLSSILRLADNTNDSDMSNSSDDEDTGDPIEDIVMDLKDLLC